MTKSVLRIFPTLFEFQKAVRRFDVRLLVEQLVTVDWKVLRRSERQTRKMLMMHFSH